MNKRKLHSIAYPNTALPELKAELSPAYAEISELLSTKMKKIAKLREHYKKDSASKEIGLLSKELTKKSFESLGLHQCASSSTRETQESQSKRMLMSQLLNVFLQFFDISHEEFYHQPTSQASSDIVNEGLCLMRKILLVCKFPNIKLNMVNGIILFAIDATCEAQRKMLHEEETASGMQAAYTFFTLSSTLLGTLLRTHNSGLPAAWSGKLSGLLEGVRREHYYQTAEQLHNMLVEPQEGELQDSLQHSDNGLKSPKASSMELLVSRCPKYLGRVVYQVKTFVEVAHGLLAPRTAVEFSKKFRVGKFDVSCSTNKVGWKRQASNLK